MCSAGGRPAGVRIGSPVAGRAGRRVTKGSEAPRQPHPRDERKFSGRNESEREVAPKVSSPGGRARNREGEGSTARRRPIDAAGCSGGVVSDGTSTRTHQATGETLLVPTRKGGSWVSRITGNTGKSADDERVADGSVVATRRGHARGAKGPCYPYLLRQEGRQGCPEKSTRHLQDLRRGIYAKGKAELGGTGGVGACRRKRCRHSRSHKPWREAGRKAECGIFACSV